REMAAALSDQSGKGAEQETRSQKEASLRSDLDLSCSAAMASLKPRAPQTPDEEAELRKIAEAGGPKAVYEWIYGKDSPMARMVPFSGWEGAGGTAEEGVKQILDGIRAFAK